MTPEKEIVEAALTIWGTYTVQINGQTIKHVFASSPQEAIVNAKDCPEYIGDKDEPAT